jgi:hypothetical protein
MRVGPWAGGRKPGLDQCQSKLVDKKSGGQEQVLRKQQRHFELSTKDEVEEVNINHHLEQR